MSVKMGRTKEPILASVVQQTTAVWSALREFKVRHPAVAVSDKDKKDSSDKDAFSKVLVPEFDFRTFLDEPEP
jgi:hypothetical protein